MRRIGALVLATAVAGSLAFAGQAQANHLFPLFPGDPLGDCGQVLEHPPPVSNAVVHVNAFFFVDSETLSSKTVIQPGETVTWQWDLGHCHSVTTKPTAPVQFATYGGEQGLEPELVRPNGDANTFSVTLTEPGVYEYICQHHRTLGMTGTVEVVAAPAG